MEECIFCKIVENKIPSEKIYEDETLVAIRDVNPAAPTHILIIPRKHIPTINDIEKLPDDSIASLLKTAVKLAAREGIADEGYRVIINCNRAAGQEVFHLHVHVLGGRPMGKMG